MEGMESCGDGGESAEDEHPDLSLLEPETVQRAIREIQRSFTRSRKAQIKLVFQINLYFEKLSLLLREKNLQSYLRDIIFDIQTLIMEMTKLSITLSNPPSRIFEIFDTLYDMGAYIETIVIAIYTWCQRSGQSFGERMKKFLNDLIRLSCDNPETWLYSVLISPIILHMLNAFAYSDHEDFRIEWCSEVTDLMFLIAKAVYKCGDFSCQYFLITVFSFWAKWAPADKSISVINSVFGYVSGKAKQELMYSSESNEASVRIFLNAFNLSPRGPKSVIPIQCMYVFVCGTEIRPPEHQVPTSDNFWVDFSIISGRIHTFYSIPGEASLASLSIRRDHIDSICLNWVINDGRGLDMDTQETQDTQSTFEKNEKVLFFHIVLNVDFEAVTSDIASLVGKQYRSIYFVFRNGELVEKVMKDMGYKIHECGTKNCERPRALRRLLTSEHKLSYTQSWCPESQVFGLDKSLNTSNVCASFSKTGFQDHSLDVFGENSSSQKENDEFLSMNIQTSGSRRASSSCETSKSYVSISPPPQEHSFALSPTDRETTRPQDPNLSTSTNFEDPLPQGVRNKFSHLYKHAPFQPHGHPNKIKTGEHKTSRAHSSKRFKEFHIIRNSSPKPSAPLLPPITPPVSEIGSPKHDMWNLTLNTIDEDDNPEISSEEIFPNKIMRSPENIIERDLTKIRLNISNGSDVDVCGENELIDTSNLNETIPKRNTRKQYDDEVAYVCGENECMDTTNLNDTDSKKNTSKQYDDEVSYVCEENEFMNTSNLNDTNSKKNTSKQYDDEVSYVCEENEFMNTSNLNDTDSKKNTSKQYDDEVSYACGENEFMDTTNLNDTNIKKKVYPTTPMAFQLNTSDAKENSHLSKVEATEVSDDDEVMSHLTQMSPVYGFSRTLNIHEKDEVSPVNETFRRSLQSDFDAPIGGVTVNMNTCYANSLREWENAIMEKQSKDDYDPYDLWSSSEMDEYRQQLFPKRKTYSISNKRKNFGRKKTGKLGRLKNQGIRAMDGNSEELTFKAYRPIKYATLFKGRD